MQPMKQTSAASRRRIGALPILALGFVLVVFGAWYTDIHRPLPNALQPVTGLRWWFTPMERNAFMRMPVIDGNLHAIDVFDGGRVLWAVGDQGLIVGSRDGGRSWLRGTILTKDVPAETTPSPTSRLKAFNFIGSAYAAENPALQSPELTKGDYYDPKAQYSDPKAQYNAPNAAVRINKVPPGNAAKTPAPAKATPPEADAPVKQSPVQTAVPATPHDPTRAALYGVAVIDAKRAVAVGEDGLILLTTDGGETWRSRTTIEGESFVAVSFIGAVGVAITDAGRVAFSTNAGDEWTVGEEGTAATRAIARLGAKGWLAIGGGKASIIGVSSEMPPVETYSASAQLQSIAARDEQTALAVGAAGAIARTMDGGRSWVTVPFAGEESNPDFTAVAFAPNGDWLVAASAGNVYASSNQGSSWTRVRNGEQPNAIAAFASVSDVLYGVGRGGVIERSSTDVAQWNALAISHGTFASLQMMDSSRGVITGANGLRLVTSDRGQTWRVRAADNVAQPAAPPKTALFDGQRGMKINASGALVRTENAGGTWTPVVVSTGVPLLDVQFVSKKHGVLLGLGRVFISGDAGATFTPVTYRRYPSPWIWLASALLLSGAFFSARRHMRAPAVAHQPSSITDAAASDRPIGWSDPDPAGLRDIALGLSRFMRNRRTEPPLTIAITGEWGTGKSSLMNLLRHDLQRYGYKPVWFNAWHHQSGENLLGSLLANIHAQGVPAWHTLSGVDFRATLLWIRARRFWLRLALTLFLLAVIFFSYSTLGASADKLWDSLSSASSSGFSDIGAATGLLGLLVALLTPVLGAVRAVSAFGLQPSKLIAAVATTRTDESARQQAGARYRFALEFDDFTRALDPRPLVIFIDDLDRCRAENVIEVLEAVNFLVSSGRCIVVIGMARRWVETCVGLAFKDLAMAQADAPSGQEAPDPLTEQQIFARNYLEKLINVEIRVPRLSDSAARALLQGEEPLPDEGNAKRAVARAAFWLAPQLLLAITVGVIVWFGSLTAEWLKDLDAQAQRREQVVAAATSGSTSRALPPTTATPSNHETGTTSARVTFENANAQAPWGWYFGTGGALLLALVGLGLLALFARKEARTDDSPDFRDALAILQPWIALGGASPRSLKRFVNHVRYIAMRFRAGTDFPNLLERCAERLRRSLGTTTADGSTSDAMPRVQLSEELLVAFATLHRCDERWLEQLFLARSAKLEDLADRLLAVRFPEATDRAVLLQHLIACLADFNRRFPGSALGHSELMDRRYAVAFYEAMAIDAGVREQWAANEPTAAAPLRPAAS